MPNLTSITISPSNPFKLVSTTQQFTLTGHYSDASDDPLLGLDSTTVWTSGTPAVATISNAGPSKGTATILTISGSSIITAEYGGKIATTILKVGLANYSRIIEMPVEKIRDGETIGNAAHNPISRLSVPNISMYSGGVTFLNANASAGGPIGYTTVSGHPGNFTSLYIANEVQQDGYWVQQNASGYATTSFSGTQKNLGVVASVSFDASGNQIGYGGNPVMVQIAGEAYVYATSPVVVGDFLGPDTGGKIKYIYFDPQSPTPILGYALENYGLSFPGMVLMRIQICGE